MERLWRTVKYEEVYLKAYSNGREARPARGLLALLQHPKTHQALGYRDTGRGVQWRLGAIR